MSDDHLFQDDVLTSGRSATTPTRVTRLEIEPDAVEALGVTVRHLKRVEEIELKTLDVEPGGSTPYHTHAHAHEGVVVRGRGALRLADRREPLEPGSVFSVTPGEAHAVESEGGEPLRFVCLDCFVT